jgi:hypothetical protein
MNRRSRPALIGVGLVFGAVLVFGLPAEQKVNFISPGAKASQLLPQLSLVMGLDLRASTESANDFLVVRLDHAPAQRS